MEGTFKSRLDSVFGALAAQPSSNALSEQPAPFWSVSGGQVERREWRRPVKEDSDEEDGPSASRYEVQNGGMSWDDEDMPEKRTKLGAGKEHDMDDDVLEVQEMIGMDTTVDSEDEEDEYDKVAMGREGAGDRLYMKEVSDGFDSGREIPNSFRELKKMRRDERALHEAAADRLAEDAREAAMNGTADLFKKSVEGRNVPLPVSVQSHSEGAQSGVSCLKSDVKRKPGLQGGSQLEKRVRFTDEGSGGEISSLKADEAVGLQKSNRGDRYKNVPDHVRHPEKYTHYTLDWLEEMSSESNVNAWRSTMAAVDSSSNNNHSEMVELPKSVTFIPRSSRDAPKKDPLQQHDAVMEDVKLVNVTVAARAGLEEEDVTESIQDNQYGSKPLAGQRSYRSKARENED